MVKVMVDSERCTCDGLCVDIYPVECLKMENRKVIAVGECHACHACEIQCPESAIEIIEE